MKDVQINFRFARNWKTFSTWYSSTKQKGIATSGAPWDTQKKKISEYFEQTVPDIVDWKRLWSDFEYWYKDVTSRKAEVFWSEQKNQIETLMLEQVKELGEKIFVLAFLDKGKPTLDPTQMSYWEALKVKKELEGDENGAGGDEDLDRITIVNLKKILN